VEAMEQLNLVFSFFGEGSNWI